MPQTPHHTTETSIFARPLWALTLVCCRFPKTVLFLTLLLAGLSLYWAAEHLGLKMSRLDLINPNSSFNQLWLDYIDEFGDDNEVIIVAEGPDNAEVTQTLERLAAEIGKFPELYQDTLHGIDLTAIHRKGLHYVPMEELRGIRQFVGQALNNVTPTENTVPSAERGLNNVPSPLGGRGFLQFPPSEGGGDRYWLSTPLHKFPLPHQRGHRHRFRPAPPCQSR